MKLTGKTILLTGASRGIGKALLDQFVNEDCKVIALARNITAIENEYSAHTNVTILKCDVSDKEEIEKVWEVLSQEKISIDIALLNAGYGTTNFAQNLDSSLGEHTFAVNYFANVYFIEKLLPDMLEKNSGFISVVSSLADVKGFPGSGFYCASKAAMSNYMEALGVELKKTGVKVCTIRPGFVKTDMTAQNNFKMPFLMNPPQAAKIIIKGIKKEKRMINFPWQTTLATKFAGLLPTTLYQFLSKSKL